MNRFLVCSIDSESYISSFYSKVCKSMEEAGETAVGICRKYGRKEPVKESDTRYTVIRDDGEFTVAEILEVPPTGNVCIKYHAYEGVDFEAACCGTDADVQDYIRQDMEAMRKELEIEEECDDAIDDGDEWHVWKNIAVDQDQMFCRNVYTGEDVEVSLRVENFGNSEMPICIQLYDEDGPYATVTKNFGSFAGNNSIVMPCCGWVDVNNFPGAPEFIAKYGLGEPVIRFGDPVVMYSGICAYPYYRFNQDELMRLDPKGVEAYMSSWKKGQKKALKKIAGC